VKSWLDEQAEYRLAKMKDGEEMAWLLVVCIFVACMIGLLNVVWDRWIVPWLMR